MTVPTSVLDVLMTNVVIWSYFRGPVAWPGESLKKLALPVIEPLLVHHNVKSSCLEKPGTNAICFQ